MSWVPPRAVRRAVLDPLWLPLAIALMLLLLAAIAIGGMLAPLTRRRRGLRVATMGLVYLAIDVRLMLVAFGLWLHGPRDRQLVRARHTALLAHALDQLMRACEGVFGYRVTLVGRPIVLDERRPLIVLARHAGPGDSFTLVHLLASGYGRNPRVVLKRALQWDPGLDVVLTRLDSYFMPSSSGAGEDRAAAVAELARRLTPHDALLLFPEGGNWTPRRHRRAVVRLLRAGRRREARLAAARTHVLPPRPGGIVAALSARDDTDVLVVAHAGLDTLVNPRQMWDALPLDDRPMRIRARLFAAADVPRDPDLIEEWVTQRWADIDEWVHTERDYD